MKKNCIKSDSNKGAALLSVIIVMAVVGILASLVLSISYTNYRMKIIDDKSKDNFYTAEAVLDEICVGIQRSMSNQYEKAYVSVMENYGYYETVEEMQYDFDSQFVLNMVEEYKVNTSDKLYDITKLVNHVDPKNFPDGGEPTVTCVENRNNLDTLEDGLVFRNIVVSYREGSYINTITTDIKVGIPEISFSKIANMPEIADYCLVAEHGVEIVEGNDWKINGSVYAGKMSDASGNKTDTSILIDTSATLDASDEDAVFLVSEGNVKLNGAASLKTGNETAFWAQGIEASASTQGTNKIAQNNLYLLGRTYIKDDTTLNGKANNLTLAGQYFGYSNDDGNAKESSAIIINGTQTSIDMSQLDSLVLAGTSFVSATSVVVKDANGNVLNTDDVLMGDSIAVKSNQLAYLVPDQCAGVVRNPMTNSQFNAMKDANGDGKEDTDWKDKILDTTISGLGRSIGSYGRSKIDVIPVHTPGNVVYLYLKFSDASVASDYFMDYYNKTSGGRKLQDYVGTYVNSLKTNEHIHRIVTEGNYLVPLTGGKVSYHGSTETASLSAQEVASFATTFEALCKKLTTNGSAITSAERSGTVYSNLISEEKIDEFFATYKNNLPNNGANSLLNVTFAENGKNRIATIQSEVDGKTVKVVIVDNNDAGCTPYILNGSNSGSGIIIATGDIQANGGSTLAAWDGLILCNGKVTLGTSSTIKNNPNAVGKAMQLVCGIGGNPKEENGVTDIQYAKEYGVLNFFKGGENFTVGSPSSDPNARTDIRDCIVFENWQSE